MRNKRSIRMTVILCLVLLAAVSGGWYFLHAPAGKEDTALFMEANDPQNPLHVYRRPITQNIRHIADSLAKGAASDHEKMLRFMARIGDSSVAFPSAPTPDAMLAEKTGSCGDFSNTLAAMAATQGIKTRLFAFYNWPPAAGHVVMEAYIDHQWRLYDPTYGAYYYLASDPQKLPLSFERIREAYGSGKDVRLSLTLPRLGVEEYTGPNIFIHSNPVGIIGQEYPLVFPLTLDMQGKTSIEQKEFAAHYRGARYIGAADSNKNQRWTFKNLAVGKRYVFTMHPDALFGDMQADEHVFDIAASLTGGTLETPARHRFDFSGADHRAKPLRIVFTPAQTSVTLLITHPYSGPEYRYMFMQRYTLDTQPAS